jgi:transglutaminase/protease-like cytokinesis protein 3
MKFILIIFCFSSVAFFAQSKKEVLYKQNLRIDSLTEALQIQKDEFAAAERRFEKNNEKMKLIDQQIISWHDQYVNSYHAIDYHMAMCPKSIKKDPEQLIAYFLEVANTDLEKCRAVYTWIAYNIKYDDVAYNNKTESFTDPFDILKEQKAMCGGFSALFYFLCSKMNLEVKSVSGYCKGYQFSISKETNSNATPTINHGWNFVKIKGEWRAFDVTWGSGSAITTPNGLMKSVYEFTDEWFNCSPEEFVFSHYPESQEDLHLEKPISLKSFFKLPEVSMSAFSTGLLNAKETLDACQTKQENSFPEILPVDTYVKIINAPKSGILQLGVSYYFEMYIPRANHVYAFCDGYMQKEFSEGQDGAIFKGNIIPKTKGKLTISIDHYFSKNTAVLLKYEVK